MDKFPGTTTDGPQDSADTMDNINEKDVDHSQSAPADEDTGIDDPSASDAFRGGM